MQEPRREAERTTPQPETPVSGAPAGFEGAYLMYATRLRKIAVRKFRIPVTEAETLVHDVFATYFTHAASVRAVEPYLIGAICNAARHYMRRADATDALFCGEMPCAATPDDALLDEVTRKLLLSKLLAGVGSRCRGLLHSYYVSGETTQAIADVMDSTPGTIRVFLHKCRKRALTAYRSLVETS